jgi:hypothetical protein
MRTASHKHFELKMFNISAQNRPAPMSTVYAV